MKTLPPRHASTFLGDPESLRNVDVVVVLPTLNEAAGLGRTLDDIPLGLLRTSGWTARILVVDGGSRDGAVSVASARSVPVLRQASRGKGGAIREALAFLASLNVRFAVILDADYTYPGRKIPAVVELLDAGSQLVVGIRQPERAARADYREAFHRLGNRLLNLAASQLAGLPLLDLCSGFWGVNVRAIPPLDLETNGFDIEAELFTKAYRAGFTVTQIPIPYRPRVGVAKLHAFRDGLRILLTTIRFGRRRLSAAFTPPRPSQLLDFISIALVHGADEILLVADGSRTGEAEQLAERIRSAHPDTRLRVHLVPTALPIPAEPVDSEVARGRPITITLPALMVGSATAPPYATVHLPKSGRVVTVDDRSGSPHALGPLIHSPGKPTLSGAYHLEFPPVEFGSLRRVRSIAANAFPSEEAKEIAFLGANGRPGGLAVWLRDDFVALPTPEGPPQDVEAAPFGGITHVRLPDLLADE